MKLGIYILTVYPTDKHKFKHYKTICEAYLKDKHKCNTNDTECLQQTLLHHYDIIKTIVGEDDIDDSFISNKPSNKSKPTIPNNDIVSKFLATYKTIDDCPDEFCKGVLTEYNSQLEAAGGESCPTCALNRIKNNLRTYITIYNNEILNKQ